MRTRISQLLGLRPGEVGIVLVLSLLLMGNSLALEVSNVVSVSGFLNTVGVKQILIVWLVDMVLVLVSTSLQSLAVDRYNRVSLLSWMAFGFAIFYVLLRLMFVLKLPGWINYSLLFLLTDQQWLFFPLLFWILANDILDMAQAKRLFPLIASGGFVGQIIGLGLAAAAPPVLEKLQAASTELLSLNILIYLAAYMIITQVLGKIVLRPVQRQSETVRETLTEGWGFVREVASFRFLVMAMVLVSIAFTIVEFHFLVVSDSRYTEAGHFQTFYGLYNLGVIVAAILIQSLLTRRIINRFNLRNIFLLFPLMLLGGIGWIMALPGLISSIGGVTLPRLMKETVDESSRKSFQALVPEERRGRVSMFMDSYVFAVGAIIGCVITGLVVVLGDWLDVASAHYLYLGIAGVVTLGALVSIFRMRAVYDTSLLNWRLKRRRRGGTVLDKLEF